ncbi:MAG: CapA family protein, partial [Oscillospiraceae bacterium]|nr:CapA family protein [Oscillospiraceae bacterium]
MKKLIKFMILFLLILTLAVLQFYRYQQKMQVSLSSETQPSNTMAIASPTSQSTPVPSTAPVSTPSPTPTPTPEPTPELFTISVIGDETLANRNGLSDESQYSFGWWMKGDFSYPFKNTSQYFLDDELTITNLECTFADQQIYSDQQFNFRAPTANAQILVDGGV